MLTDILNRLRSGRFVSVVYRSRSNGKFQRINGSVSADQSSAARNCTLIRLPNGRFRNVPTEGIAAIVDRGETILIA